MEYKFSIYLKRFRKNNSTQSSLLKMNESWKARLNNGSGLDCFGRFIQQLRWHFYSDQFSKFFSLLKLFFHLNIFIIALGINFDVTVSLLLLSIFKVNLNEKGEVIQNKALEVIPFLVLLQTFQVQSFCINGKKFYQVFL